MSDKPAEKKDAKKDEKAGEEKKAAGGGLMSKTPVLLAGVMIIQAGIVLAGVKLLIPSTPAAATAGISEGDGHSTEGDAAAHGTEGGDAPAGGDAAHGGGEGGAEAKDPKAGDAKSYDPKKSYEIKLIEIKAPNKTSGRTFVYDLKIVLLVKGKNAKKVETIIAEREALIQDRIRTIIAQSDPEKLGGGSEPGLETLRRQVKYHFDEITSDPLVEEVLVPRCIPFRTDF